jgi:hypothetical protein
MAKIQKPSNSKCYTPLSEPFRVYIFILFEICNINYFLPWTQYVYLQVNNKILAENNTLPSLLSKMNNLKC